LECEKRIAVGWRGGRIVWGDRVSGASMERNEIRSGRVGRTRRDFYYGLILWTGY
jgi:hypothetical protein